jgi:hypothetical protein
MSMLDPAYADGLRARIVQRAHDQWPGVHHLPARGSVLIGPVTDGGATAALIEMVADIAIDELAR